MIETCLTENPSLLKTVGRYNDIYRGADTECHASCMTPHLLLQYGKIGNESKDTPVPYGAFGYLVTMNVYSHFGFDDVEEELKRLEEFRKAQAEVEENEKPMSQKMFKAI